ncbi:MAG: IS21 family transposase [Saprospiraceae bacterium]|nr:IS21 family transposase [Saprospiraceae bacterium]
MAGSTIKMNQIRQIIQSKIKGLSKRKISKITGISRNTIKVYLRRIEGLGLALEELLKLNDSELSELCCGPQEKPPPGEARYAFIQNKLPEWVRELENPKVTRQLLWEEYKAEYPEGYSYSQFCYYLQTHLAHKQSSAIHQHKPAEKLMIDFAGSKLEYVDWETGEVIRCEVFVGVLPYSHLMYCEAVHSQGQPDFVKAVVNNLNYLGGVPQCILCDNLKSAVKKANRYEPVFTELCEQLAVHYGTTFMATRVRKPKDKASVEGAVKIAYQRIYAKLRHRIFYSLEELNAGIRQELETLNSRPFKGKGYSRKDLFKAHEIEGLSDLPSQSFVVKRQVSAKVQKNYHVILGEDMHQYSVPYLYVGKQIRIVYTSEWVEVYDKLQRIAFHKRNRSRHAYTTDPSHLAPNHRAMYEAKGWNADYFEKQAEQIGPGTKSAIQRILKSRSFPEQTYNSCLGILRLANKYGPDRVENACQMVLPIPKVNYSIIQNILKHGMDKRAEDHSDDFLTPRHDNLRGSSTFF